MRPFHLKLLLAVIVVAVLGGLYGLGRWAKSQAGSSAVSTLATRVGCTDVRMDGQGFASSDLGHCTVDGVLVQLATFSSNRDRDRWVSARRTVGSLAVDGTAPTCIAQGDLWAIETSSGAVCSEVAGALGGKSIE